MAGMHFPYRSGVGIDGGNRGGGMVKLGYRGDMTKVNPNLVLPSRHSLFVRGFPGSMEVDEIRNFFYDECNGKCKVDFVSYSDDKRRVFVALRFESNACAREIMRRFDGKEVLGYYVEISWFKDLRKARAKLMDHHGGRGQPFPRGNVGYRRAGYRGGGNPPWINQRPGRFRQNSGGSPERQRPRRYLSRSISKSRSRSRSFPNRRRSSEAMVSRSPSVASHNSVASAGRSPPSQLLSRSSSGAVKGPRAPASSGSDSSSSPRREKRKKRKKRKRRRAPSSDSDSPTRSLNSAVKQRPRTPPEDLEGDLRSLTPCGDLEPSVDYQMEQPGGSSSPVTRRVTQTEEEEEEERANDSNPKRKSPAGESKQDTSNRPSSVASAVVNGQGSSEANLGELLGLENGSVCLSPDNQRRVKSRKDEIEKGYRKDCETCATVVKMLISKDRDMEERLLVAMKEVLREIGQQCVEDLRHYIKDLTVNK